jgi:hypothetical protein
MANKENLLVLLDQLLATAVQKNVYSDHNSFLDSLSNARNSIYTQSKDYANGSIPSSPAQYADVQKKNSSDFQTQNPIPQELSDQIANATAGRSYDNGQTTPIQNLPRDTIYNASKDYANGPIPPDVSSQLEQQRNNPIAPIDRTSIYTQSQDFTNGPIPLAPTDRSILSQAEQFELLVQDQLRADAAALNGGLGIAVPPANALESQAQASKSNPNDVLSRDTIYNSSIDYANNKVPEGVEQQLADSKANQAFSSRRFQPNSNLPKGVYTPTQGSSNANAVPNTANIQLRGDQSFQGGNLYDDRGPNLLGYTGKHSLGLPAGAGVADPFALAHWLRNILRSQGIVNAPGDTSADRISRLSRFAVNTGFNVLLATFNGGDPQLGGPLNQLPNPLSFGVSAIPGLRLTNAARPTASGLIGFEFGGVESAALPDRLSLMRSGLYVKALDADRLLFQANPVPVGGITGGGFRGDVVLSKDMNDVLVAGIPYAINEQVDGEGLLGQAALNDEKIYRNVFTSNYTSIDANPADLSYLEGVAETALGNTRPEDNYTNASTLKTSALFKANTTSALQAAASVVGAKEHRDRYYNWLTLRRDEVARQYPNDKIKVGDYGEWHARVFDGGSTIEDTGEVYDQQIGDEKLYMPFSFQDLRNAPPKFLYFRAFLKEDSISESYAPDWKTEQYYGRVDQVPTYMGTSRTINLSFDVVAFTPVDLPVMYRKIHQLTSMVYPSFTEEGYVQNGPIIRMRVGDLFASANKLGLAGYVSALDLEWSDTVWSVETGSKVPRKCTINIAFNVLHEQAPGLHPTSTGYQFGTLNDEGQISEESIRGYMKTVVDDYEAKGLNNLLPKGPTGSSTS